MSIKRKKQVRCTLCTPNKWKGNKKDRLKPRQANQKSEAKKEIKNEN